VEQQSIHVVSALLLFMLYQGLHLLKQHGERGNDVYRYFSESHSFHAFKRYKQHLLSRGTQSVTYK